MAPKLLISSLLLLTVALPANAQEKESVALSSRITRVQPMTGVVLWTDNEEASKSKDSIALEYRYVGYNEVAQPNGDYDFAKLDKILEEVAERNHQAILRFYFCYVGKQTTVPQFVLDSEGYKETIGKSENKKTHFCDWSSSALQEFTLEFYKRFAGRYDGDRRIAFLQTGFGLWAEFHIYDGPNELGKTFPSKDFQGKFLRHMDEQFEQLPWSISIDSADFDYTPLEENEELLALEFGVFDDSFLCKPHPKENAVNWKILDENRWRRQPGGGEFSYYNKKDQKNALAANGPNGVSFRDAAKQFHITYMIGNDQPRYQSMERIAEAGMATGYRFRITSATKTSNGNSNELKIRVANEGVAPIYRDAYLAAGTKRSKTSLKGLPPGESLECVVTGVSDSDLGEITIQSDAILQTQKIEFNADLK